MRRAQEDSHPSKAARPPGLQAKEAADSTSPDVKGLYRDHKPQTQEVATDCAGS